MTALTDCPFRCRSFRASSTTCFSTTYKLIKFVELTLIYFPKSQAPQDAFSFRPYHNVMIPLQLRTKLDASPIHVRFWNGASPTLVRRRSEGRAKEKRNNKWKMKSEKWSKCEFRKNFFAIILHTYIDTPCITLYINTLQRFQISFKPTLNLHSTYTNNYVSSTISTTCTTSKYFSPSKHIISIIYTKHLWKTQKISFPHTPYHRLWYISNYTLFTINYYFSA